jgi:hypothetical protein
MSNMIVNVPSYALTCEEANLARYGPQIGTVGAAGVLQTGLGIGSSELNCPVA